MVIHLYKIIIFTFIIICPLITLTNVEAADTVRSVPQLRIVSEANVTNSRSFMIFFNYDSYSLLSPSRDLLRHISLLLKDKVKATVILTGHTDRAGSEFYNLGLSQRRALAVKAFLKQLGLHADTIHVYWRGEYEPLIRTNDGANEIRNRRVEIVLQNF